MRLLKYEEDGDLTIIDFSDNAIPPYAILSHTWGAEEEEVTFTDLVKGNGKIKRGGKEYGYKKIRFCGQQAQQDGLQYFWVDTCCIDKTDKAELSQAIRSMFRWYQNATRCYVYLSDVSTRKRKLDDMLTEVTWEPAFRESRWFTRGWTLQELLAPSTVDFFSQEWERLGNKISLKSLIHKITGIPHKALNGTPLSQFSVDERLRWKGDRDTKRDEDAWYSLSGIFDVEIAPAYSEGAASAFQRLMGEIYKLERCIQDIRGTDPRDDKKRIEETKGGLLTDSYRWVLDNTTFKQWQQEDQNSRLLWVKGDPGKGKTMLLCGIIDELYNSLPKTALLSYFFCQATDSRINNATAVLRGLMYMLVTQQPSLVSHIRKKHDHASKALFEDANAWVALTEIFEDVLQDPRLSTTYLVIDALDECVADLPKLLHFVAKQSLASSRVRWIVSSRNWPSIEEQLEQAGHKVKLSLELNVESVSAAVGAFIHQKVSQLAQQRKYDRQTEDAVFQHLMLKADGTFLWVALVCQNLEKTAKRNVLKKLDFLPPGLDALYERMMQQISASDDNELCKQVLASIALVYRPVMLKELVVLVEALEDVADETELREIISLCGSFLTVREDTVYFVHQSAKDFLLEKGSSNIFPSGKENVHRLLFARSLQAISISLERDMYNLRAPGYPIEQVKPPQPDPLASSRYSCTYWVDHLYNWNYNSSTVDLSDLQDGGSVDMFLRQKYLYWLEALSLCKNMSTGVVSMAKLEGLIQKRVSTSTTLQLVRDARRFIMYHKGIIENAPLQTYMSALVFSPKRSMIRNLFEHQAPSGLTLKPTMIDTWGACLQTLEGHSNIVNSAAFSHDATRIVSASMNVVKIWDTSSGEHLRTLEGHSDQVDSVAFSNDSTRIVSAPGNVVKIWDASSGEHLHTFEGHSNSITSVAFSHNSTRIVSASLDDTVKIWDASSGELLHTLEGHSAGVNSVAFSHNSTQIASASYDKTVKIWDASSGELLHALEGHSAGVSSVAFSHNSTQIASASYDKTVKIWDASSGEHLHTLEGHNAGVTSIAFSHNSTQIVSASYRDKMIQIWDTSSGEHLKKLEGHSHGVSSVAFSHNSTQIVSASWDKTVKIWDASSDKNLHTLQDHSDSVTSITLSYNSTRIASASYRDKTIKIWDASSGELLHTLEGHSAGVNSVAFSHNSTRIVSASYDTTVKIWDASSGEHLHTLKGHSGGISSVVFSHDSTQIASASLSGDKTVKIWDANSGENLHTLEGHSDGVKAVAFSHNSTRIVSASFDTTIKIWDASGGKHLHTFRGHSDSVTSVAFSPNSTRIASASYDKTVKIWDTSSGQCLQTLEVGRILMDITFDPTGFYLHTEVGAIVVSDSAIPNRMTAVTDTQPLQYQHTALDSDNLWITYNSKKILRLPSEYRPSTSAVSGNMVVIGSGSGKVWICNLNPDVLR